MRDAISRRVLLAGGAGLALAGVAGCGGVKGEAQTAAKRRAAEKVHHPREPIGRWTFSNWPLYMDKRILRDFDRRYGGHVKYLEDINDVFEFYGRIHRQLEQGRPIGRDLIMSADYIVARMIRLGYLEPIDWANVPNAENLVDDLRTINYDPQRRYTLPYQSGALGLGYDISKTGRELRSLDDLFDPRFKGRVTMLSEAYDAASTMLIRDGIDPSKATLDQLLAAIEKIDAASRAGQFRRFTGNDYATDLAKGNVWVSLAYSGDLLQLRSDNPNLRFAYPEEGAIRFTDNLSMPSTVEHPYAAETMMNFLYDPEVAARLTAYVNYMSPVKGVREILERTHPKLVGNPLIFPPADVVARFHAYPVLTPADERAMQEAMARVTGR